MPCNQDCNQGRTCNCSRTTDRATVIVVTLMIVAIVSMCFGFYKLINGNAGQDCAVEVQFSNGVKSTYIGTSV